MNACGSQTPKRRYVYHGSKLAYSHVDVPCVAVRWSSQWSARSQLSTLTSVVGSLSSSTSCRRPCLPRPTGSSMASPSTRPAATPWRSLHTVMVTSLSWQSTRYVRYTVFILLNVHAIISVHPFSPVSDIDLCMFTITKTYHIRSIVYCDSLHVN